MVGRIAALSLTACMLSLPDAALAEKRIKPRIIEKVLIRESGRSEYTTDRDVAACEGFRLRPSDVKAFFLRSHPVPAKFSLHERYSPCYARGFVEFSDNTRGEWKISSGGTGVLTWDTGEVVHLFYRDYTWRDPFSCMYGLSDEGEC